MVAQVINLSPHETFRYYCDTYQISNGSYFYGNFGLELRHLSWKEAESIFNYLAYNKERVYQRNDGEKSVNLLLTGSLRKLKSVANRLSYESFERLSLRIFDTIKFFENYGLTDYTIGDKQFKFNKAYVMGILNVTPDSFSDKGLYFDRNKAVARGIEIIDDGADILDIGGESSRPGAERIDAKFELERIIPVLIKIKEKRSDAIISVDTVKKQVAKKALENGAHIINDISGGVHEPEILNIIAEHDAAYIIMHMKGEPKNMQDNPVYNELVSEVYDFLYNQIKDAKERGIKKIIIDPGIGFGKTVDDNFSLLDRLGDFKSLSHPILVGVSRKSFIGKTLDLEVEKRDKPTSILESLALEKGARIIRTHNIKNGIMVRDLFNKTVNSYVND